MLSNKRVPPYFLVLTQIHCGLYDVLLPPALGPTHGPTLLSSSAMRLPFYGYKEGKKKVEQSLGGRKHLDSRGHLTNRNSTAHPPTTTTTTTPAPPAPPHSAVRTRARLPLRSPPIRGLLIAPIKREPSPASPSRLPPPPSIHPRAVRSSEKRRGGGQSDGSDEAVRVDAVVERDEVRGGAGGGRRRVRDRAARFLQRRAQGPRPPRQEQSRAICKYVCRKNKPELLKDGDLKESAMVDVWLEVESNQYTPALNPILFQCLIRPMMFGAPPDEKVVEENLEKLKKVLEVYEARLTKCKYLAGDYISVADLSHVAGTVCLGATPHASVLDAYPHVKAWWTDLMARPSSQKVASLMKPPA
ncbi:hypothetical protein DAI22_01g336100 [Oryza sativa Japonica Group]|nr:hypothetical protein DAI22_01g336100 [Oryza sativa Japonica Group]